MTKLNPILSFYDKLPINININADKQSTRNADAIIFQAISQTSILIYFRWDQVNTIFGAKRIQTSAKNCQEFKFTKK